MIDTRLANMYQVPIYKLSFGAAEDLADFWPKLNLRSDMNYPITIRKFKIRWMLCVSFIFVDTLGSAKGWAAGILFSELLSAQFAHFKQRTDTFSLGVCNGCQLMAMLGWIDPDTSPKGADRSQIFLDHNNSER